MTDAHMLPRFTLHTIRDGLHCIMRVIKKGKGFSGSAPLIMGTFFYSL